MFFEVTYLNIQGGLLVLDIMLFCEEFVSTMGPLLCQILDQRVDVFFEVKQGLVTAIHVEELWFSDFIIVDLLALENYIHSLLVLL